MEQMLEVQFQGIIIQHITGNKDTDVINNIYDLYGCHLEWTLEAYDSYYQDLRGGYSGSSYSPASRNSHNPILADSSNSSRATLYIK